MGTRDGVTPELFADSGKGSGSCSNVGDDTRDTVGELGDLFGLVVEMATEMVAG